MIRVLECNRCGSVTGYDTVEELVTRVQAHHREAHRARLNREEVLVMARLQSWGQRRRSYAGDPGDSWLGAVRVP